MVVISENWPFWKKQFIFHFFYTGMCYHSLCHWMVLMQIFVSYKSSEHIYIFVQWKFVWEKIKKSVIPHTLTAHWKKGITRESSPIAFFWSIDIALLQKITASVWRKGSLLNVWHCYWWKCLVEPLKQVFHGKKVTKVITHVQKQPTKCFTIRDSKQPMVATASVCSSPEYSA